MLKHILFALLSTTLSCASDTSKGVNKISESRSPKEFLDQLCSVPDGLYLVEDPIRGWVKRSDVDELMGLIDSDLPCRSVAQTASSRLRWEGSTLGDEAAFLIEGYRKDAYPPGLTSEPLSDADRAALKEWWNAETNVNRREK